MNKLIKSTKGITLITLVITIIILLILATVTISTLIGRDGILNKAKEASEKSKIEQYKEEINLIIIDEISERQIKNKEEVFILSLESKINEKEWIKETKKCDQEGIEHQKPEENNQLIVNTRDGYEILIEIDNLRLDAKIIEASKIEDKEEKEEKTDLKMSITNNKLTEGTNINIEVNSTRKLETIEIKVQDTVLYSKNNIGTNTYKQNIGIEQLSNLGQLSFYDDITMTLEVITMTKTKTTENIEKVKNYTISTTNQLNQLADVVNSGNSLQDEIIIQVADINVNPEKWTENEDGTTTFKNNPLQWKVIGSANYDYDTNTLSNVKPFTGTYDGKQHKIEGIYIDTKERDQMGLFACNKGVIRNIILKNSTINGRYNVGGIAAGNDASGKIENCENYASVSGSRCVGGICGWSNAYLANNINYGRISSRKETGWNIQIEHIGGITGWGDGSINECINTGRINSGTLENRAESKAVGGIVGSGTNGNINKCYNIENISGSGSAVGGIIGYINSNTTQNMTINECYNIGYISGRDAGGICAWGNHTQVTDCYNVGSIEGIHITGGIITWTDNGGAITNCYNIGKIIGTNNLVGGILGDYKDRPTLTNCYNLNTASDYAVGEDIGAWGNLDNIWEGHVVTKTEEQMKGLASVLGSKWKEDTNNTNSGFPVLK